MTTAEMLRRLEEWLVKSEHAAGAVLSDLTTSFERDAYSATSKACQLGRRQAFAEALTKLRELSHDPTPSI